MAVRQDLGRVVFKFSDLTATEKEELKQDITTINARYTSTYDVTNATSVVPINISEYKHGVDLLEVYINGLKLIEGIDYTEDGTNVTLSKPLEIIGQIHIVCTKSISATTEVLDNFKGPKGDKGDKGDKGEQGIQGLQGPQGDDKVYVGSTAPTDSKYEIWINPNGPSTPFSQIASLIYPVGSIYISVSNTDPSILFGGTWVSIASGRVLMGVDASHGAGSTAEAGLPNITGSIGPNSSKWSLFNTDSVPYSGALWAGENNCWCASGTSNNAVYTGKITFDASRSNSIYGKSTTVQPPAFYVYMWRRTA